MISLVENKKKKLRYGHILLEIFMLLLSILALTPIVYEIISSFKNKAEINRVLSFPSAFNLENYKAVFVDSKFFLLFMNSAIVVGVALLITVAVGSIASHPLARSQASGYKYIYYFFLSGIMVPFQAGMIPLFKLMQTIGLNNNIFSLVLISAGTAIPMSILIYTGFIKTVPVQLEESALIDGCGFIKTFIAIVFPLLRPATVSVILLNIIPIWNDFLTPLIFISSAAKKTLPLGLYNFLGENTIDMGPIFAFSVLISILPIILFLFLQNSFYKGLTAGAVKG
jgi:raffinose/stachyose/melibiose transport system permease protein